MTGTSNLDVERAEARVAQETAAAISRAQAALAGPGETHCRTCGNEIDPVRRKALPSAKDCFGCASRAENGRRR